MALTTNDLKLIQNVVKVTIDEAVDTNPNLVKKEDLAFLPTKEEFYEQADKIMGELKAMREEHGMLSARVYDNHGPRIEKVEKKLNLSSSV